MELDLFSLRLKHRFPESNTLNYAFKYIVQWEQVSDDCILLHTTTTGEFKDG